MKLIFILSLSLVGFSAFAETCDIISVRSNQETVVEKKALGGRMNNGIVPGGFDYDITSTPGPVDFIYLKSASGQVIQASGPVTSSSTPLKVSSVDGNGNGAAISCYP